MSILTNTGRLVLCFHLTSLEDLGIGLGQLAQGHLLRLPLLHHQEQAGHQDLLFEWEAVPLGAEAGGDLTAVDLVDDLHDLRDVHLPSLSRHLGLQISFPWGLAWAGQAPGVGWLQETLLPGDGLGQF